MLFELSDFISKILLKIIDKLIQITKTIASIIKKNMYVFLIYYLSYDLSIFLDNLSYFVLYHCNIFVVNSIALVKFSISPIVISFMKFVASTVLFCLFLFIVL
jgi:hypothetical protein